MDDDFKLICSYYSGVLSGLGGLVWHYMTNMYRNILFFATTYEHLVNYRLCGASFVFYPSIDTENFLEPCSYNPSILLPTPERSLVLYQQYESIVPFDDENLMIGMQEYRRRFGEGVDELMRVADFYGRHAEIEKSWEISKTWDSEY